MYPSRELKILAERRAYLQLRIEARREDCLVAGQGVAEGYEKMMVWVRLLKAGGLASAIGSGFLALRRRRRGETEDEEAGDEEAGESSWGTKALRWAPLALRALRIVSSFI